MVVEEGKVPCCSHSYVYWWHEIESIHHFWEDPFWQWTPGWIGFYWFKSWLINCPFFAWISSINIPRHPWFSYLPYSRYPDYESSYCDVFLSVRGSTVTLKSHDFPKIQCCFFLVLMLVGYIICPLSTVPWVMCKIELPTWAWWCGHTPLEEFSFKRKATV